MKKSSSVQNFRSKQKFPFTKFRDWKLSRTKGKQVTAEVGKEKMLSQCPWCGSNITGKKVLLMETFARLVTKQTKKKHYARMWHTCKCDEKRKV